VNATNDRKETALTFCCRYGHTDTAQALLAAGLNVERMELGGPFWTSLHRAAANGHTATARLLLHELLTEVDEDFLDARAKAKRVAQKRLLDHQDGKGTTALMAAAGSNYPAMVALLLEAGANDALTLKKTGESAYHLAAKAGQAEALKVLLKSGKAEGAMNQHVRGLTPLMAATAGGHEQAVRALLHAKASVAPPEFREEDLKRAVLAALDKNGDGRVTLEEIDLNGDGEISVDEMVVACKKLLGSVSDVSDEDVAVIVGDPLDEIDVTSLDQLRRQLEKLVAQGQGIHPSTLIAVTKRSDDSLVLAARAGNEALVRILMSYNATTRYTQATRAADANGYRHLLKPDAARQFKRHPTQQTLNKASSKVIGGQTLADITIRVDELEALDFTRSYGGQLAPPRPSPQQIHKRATSTGKVHVHRGVVVQRAAFGAFYVRAGCVPHVPWHSLWVLLQSYVTALLRNEREKVEKGKAKFPGAIYVAVSEASMQAIDFTWLVAHGFVFHHYRAPGHGDDSGGDGTAAGGSAEFVYYCWPSLEGTGSAGDMVPVYSTSIEGATGVLLAGEKEDKVLLVWERGAWNTPGGAVNAGECKLEALAREVGEEVSARVDESWGAYFLGGWQEGRARDGLVNDNFSAFAMKMADEAFTVDNKEIEKARFFEWRPLLEAWRKAGRPKDFRTPAEGEKVSKFLMPWLDTYDTGRGLKCTLKSDPLRDGRRQTKVLYGSM